jgi:hypothetical protein
MSFTIAADPRQRSHSRVRVPWDSRPYFIVLDSRLPFSSLPTTRRATVEILDPASTRDLNGVLYSVSVSAETPVDPEEMCWLPRIYLCENIFHFRIPGNIRVGFQDFISTETCSSTCFLAMGLHVTIRKHMHANFTCTKIY